MLRADRPRDTVAEMLTVPRNHSRYPQHAVFFTAAVTDAALHPQPPPLDFTSASCEQHASVPRGAGPPQHADAVACLAVVVAERASAVVVAL
jgi:hypothetical protein